MLLGRGDASFSAGPSIITSLYSRSFAVGDFNRDDYADLVVLHVNEFSGDYVDVLMNDKQWGAGGKRK